MLTRHALRLRLYPDAAQAALMARIAGCCRAIYNLGLDQRRWFARPGRSLSYRRQAGEIGALKAEFDWFGEAPYHCLQQALVDLERAYENFWARRASAPKPRKRGVDDRFRFPDPTQIGLEGDLLTPDSRRRRAHKRALLKLPKLGRVRCALHRAVPAGARVCSVTVSRDGRHWVAVARLAAFKAHQARRRRDAMEKVTTAIAKSHGVVAMEDLRVRAMTASARGTVEEPGRNVAAKSGLNRSLLDVAPGSLRERLGQKLAATGGVLLLVPPMHSSQRCSRPGCGHIAAASRLDRDRFVCVACGHAADADVNAAVNVRDRAIGLWGETTQIEVAASLDLLLAQQAKTKRGFRKAKEQLREAGGHPASACPSPVRTRRAKAGNGARQLAQVVRTPVHGRSSALQGRE